MLHTGVLLFKRNRVGPTKPFSALHAGKPVRHVTPHPSLAGSNSNIFAEAATAGTNRLERKAKKHTSSFPNQVRLVHEFERIF